MNKIYCVQHTFNPQIEFLDSLEKKCDSFIFFLNRSSIVKLPTTFINEELRIQLNLGVVRLEPTSALSVWIVHKRLFLSCFSVCIIFSFFNDFIFINLHQIAVLFLSSPPLHGFSHPLRLKSIQLGCFLLRTATATGIDKFIIFLKLHQKALAFEERMLFFIFPHV